MMLFRNNAMTTIHMTSCSLCSSHETSTSEANTKIFFKKYSKTKIAHTHSHTFGNKENKERGLLLLTAMATLLASFLQTISGGMTDQWISKNRCYLKCTVLEKDWKQAQTLLQSKEYEYTVPCSSQKVLFAATILNKIRLQYLRLVYTCKAV